MADAGTPPPPPPGTVKGGIVDDLMGDQLNVALPLGAKTFARSPVLFILALAPLVVMLFWLTRIWMPRPSAAPRMRLRLLLAANIEERLGHERDPLEERFDNQFRHRCRLDWRHRPVDRLRRDPVNVGVRLEAAAYRADVVEARSQKLTTLSPVAGLASQSRSSQDAPLALAW